MILTGLLAAGAAAQDTAAQATDEPPVETLDLTMELMSEGAAAPEAITRIIELPAAAAAADAARENAARGLDEANAARERGEAGRAIAEEARERGRERAQQGREDVGRGRPESAGPPELPGGPSDTPELPDNPGPPDSPGPPGD